MAKRLRVGIVGIGHIAAHQIAALQRSPRFFLAAVCDSDTAAIKPLEAQAATFDSLNSMLNQADLDVVFVATPNHLHVDHGIAVMEAERWLVVEKPAAQTREEFERLADCRARLSGRCTIALHAAFGLEVEWFLRSRAEGELQDSHFDSFTCQFYDPYIIDGRLQAGADSLGGAWLDSGINALSVLSTIFPPASLEITASQMTRVHDLNCAESRGTVHFSFDDGDTQGSGSIETNWLLDRNYKSTRLRMAGENSILTLGHTDQSAMLTTNGVDEVLFSVNDTTPRLTNHYIGVLTDLAIQMAADTDNFDYCRRLHNLLFEAENWSL